MLENEMSPAMVDHLAAGIMKKYNDQLLSAVQRMLPELNPRRSECRKRHSGCRGSGRRVRTC